MSRRTDRAAHALAWVAGSSLAAVCLAAGGQTIADYSLAQRAVLESAMTQAAARAAGQGAGAPSAVPAAAATPASTAAPVASARGGLPVTAPAVVVSGVFAAAGSAVAEVVVDGAAYLVGLGDRVPGTDWRVLSVGVDRVVLDRATANATGTGAVRQVFALRALH